MLTAAARIRQHGVLEKQILDLIHRPLMGKLSFCGFPARDNELMNSQRKTRQSCEFISEIIFKVSQLSVLGIPTINSLH